MIQALSPGLFGLQQTDPMAGLSQFTPNTPYDPGASIAASLAPSPQPFVWGGAGERLSAADIAQKEQQARAETAAGISFAPIGSWSQGAARVAQALLGGFDQRDADKASAANVKATKDAVASLSAPGGTGIPNIAAILGDDTLSDGVHDVAKAQLAGMTKAPPKLTEFQQTAVDAGLIPGTPQWTAANQARLQNYTDPQVSVPLPGGMYVGPRSGLLAAAKGGGPASTAGGVALPPVTLPPDFDFSAGGPTPSASGSFP